MIRAEVIAMNEIKVLSPSFDDSERDQEVYGLLYNHQFSSQDALIIFTTLFLKNYMKVALTL